MTPLNDMDYDLDVCVECCTEFTPNGTLYCKNCLYSVWALNGWIHHVTGREQQTSAPGGKP